MTLPEHQVIHHTDVEPPALKQPDRRHIRIIRIVTAEHYRWHNVLLNTIVLLVAP